MVAQKNHQKTKYAMENKRHDDLFTNGEKPTRQKSTGRFSSHHSRNSTIIITSGYKKRNLNTLYQPTVEPLPQYPIGLVL